MFHTLYLTVIVIVATVLVSATNGTTISTSVATTPLQNQPTATTSVVPGVSTTINASTTTTTTTVSGTVNNPPSPPPSTEPPTDGTTTPPPTTIPTTPDPCRKAWKPTEEQMLACQDENCVRDKLGAMQFYYQCGGGGDEVANSHPTKMAALGNNLAMNIAKDIKNKVLKSQPVNETVVIVTDQLALGGSVILGSEYNDISTGRLYFPNLATQGVSNKLGDLVENAILYPKNRLPLQSGYVKVAWSISKTGKISVPESEIEPYRDVVWRLPLSEIEIVKNEIIITKKKPELKINSVVITFTLDPVPAQPLPDPLFIVFRRIKSTEMKNHRCYYRAETSPSEGFWSSVGCDVLKNNDTHTVCSCNHMSTFVVLSEPVVEPDDSAKNAVRAVCIAFCILAISALAATIHITRKTECLDNDRVNIHLHLCASLMIGYFLFIVGTIKSDVEVINHILYFGLQFAQISPLVWLCLEAIYFLNTIHPFLYDGNIEIQKMYAAFGWAMSAAFAGATCGYDFQHSGRPSKSEFVWLFVDKVKVWEFFGPFVFLVIVNVLIRAISVASLSKYTKTSDADKTQLRVIVNILTTTALLVVVVLAWCFGVKAVNNTETKGYHFGFITLYLLQACLVLIFYGWQNEEMWALHNKRKEEEKKIEEQTVTFTYVP